MKLALHLKHFSAAQKIYKCKCQSERQEGESGIERHLTQCVVKKIKTVKRLQKI